MHSRRRFALETVTALQYCCPQSGTSLMHTAVAALRNGSGNNASCGSRQLRPMPLRGARTVCAAPGTRNHCAAEPASSRSECVLCRQSAAAMSRGNSPCLHGNKRIPRHARRRPAGLFALASGDCGTCVQLCWSRASSCGPWVAGPRTALLFPARPSQCGCPILSLPLGRRGTDPLHAPGVIESEFSTSLNSIS